MLSPHTFDFLQRLKDNNSRQWVNDHLKEMNETKEDVYAFAALVVEEVCRFDPAIAEQPPAPRRCVTRLNRDLRFGEAKGPYKWDFYIVVGLQGIQGLTASYAVHIEPRNCFVGGGAPNPMGPDLLAYRRKVSDHFAAFEQIVNSKTFLETFPHGVTSQSGIVKKRVPRDFDANDPAAAYLTKEGFITRERVSELDLVSEGGFARVADLLQGSKELVGFLNQPESSSIPMARSGLLFD